MDISHLFSFLSMYYLWEPLCRTTVQRAADNVRITGVFRKGHYCAPSLRRTKRHSFARAGKVTETLCEISGPGNSVNIGNSGHRIYPGKAQNSTKELYLPLGKDGTLRDYDYGILQIRNLNFKYLYFDFGAVLTWPNHTDAQFSQRL